MAVGSVISAAASRAGMSSQPLGGGNRPTCEVLIRVTLRCMPFLPTLLFHEFKVTSLQSLFICVSFGDFHSCIVTLRAYFFHVRRAKAALSSGCKAHPAIRSSRKQPEQAWR